MTSRAAIASPGKPPAELEAEIAAIEAAIAGLNPSTTLGQVGALLRKIAPLPRSSFDDLGKRLMDMIAAMAREQSQ